MPSKLCNWYNPSWLGIVAKPNNTGCTKAQQEIVGLCEIVLTLLLAASLIWQCVSRKPSDCAKMI